MLATTLRYDMKSGRERSLQINFEPAHRQVDGRTCRTYFDTKAGRFDASKFKDEYELALRILVKRNASGKTIEPPAERPDSPM